MRSGAQSLFLFVVDGLTITLGDEGHRAAAKIDFSTSVKLRSRLISSQEKTNTAESAGLNTGRRMFQNHGFSVSKRHESVKKKKLSLGK